jgi:hypothetical protein
VADVPEGDGAAADDALAGADAVATSDDVGNEVAESGAAGDEDADATRPLMVPDFKGLTVAAVLRAANRTGVELALGDGGPVTGVAVRQMPAPGPARSGVVCRVTFARPD